jgi:hypothetical protein
MQQIIDLRVELTEKTNQLASLKANTDGMKQVLVSTIQSNTVKLGSSAAATATLMATGVSSLLQQHATLTDQMEQRFGAGGRLSKPVDENDPEIDKAANHLDAVYLTLAKVRK